MSGNLLAILARDVLTVRLRELLAVRSQVLPVADKSLVADSFGHLNNIEQLVVV